MCFRDDCSRWLLASKTDLVKRWLWFVAHCARQSSLTVFSSHPHWLTFLFTDITKSSPSLNHTETLSLTTGFILVSKPILFSHIDNKIFSSGWLENVVWQRKEKPYTATKGHSWHDLPIYQLGSVKKKSSLATGPWGSCSSRQPTLEWHWPAFINRVKACTISCFSSAVDTLCLLSHFSPASCRFPALQHPGLYSSLPCNCISIHKYKC